MARICALICLVILQACGPSYENGPPPASEAEIAALARAIEGLAPAVDPDEAARAAFISYDYPLTLAQRYEITDPPIIHNQKVNRGTKSRGLCWHWAEDMQRRLEAEGFRTLALHRAIATPPFRLEHSTVVISANGAGFRDGLVIDPWRKAGVLFWAPVPEDTRYPWRARAEVLAEKRAEAGYAALLPGL